MKKIALIGFAVLGLAACNVSSPEPDYFSLADVPGEAIPGVAAVVRVQRPVLAGYLDRGDFVRQQGDYQLLIDNTDNWAEPLDGMFARVLAADMQQRLPDSTIANEGNVTPHDLRFTVDMNIERFNQAGDGLLLQGEAIVTDRKDWSKKMVPVKVTAATDGSPESVVAGMSAMVGDMATQLAREVIVPGVRKDEKPHTP